MFSRHTNRTSQFIFSMAGICLFAACSVNVKKSDEAGHDKKVDIETPIGGIHVSNDADVHDTGLPVYPGARPTKKGSGSDEKSANVNISGPGFALRVLALEYESDDAADKLVSYYKDQLKKFGAVVECRTDKHGGDVPDVNVGDNDGKADEPVSCGADNHGSNIELKVGKRNDQHIVAIEPATKGSKLALVYIRTRGKKDTI